MYIFLKKQILHDNQATFKRMQIFTIHRPNDAAHSVHQGTTINASSFKRLQVTNDQETIQFILTPKNIELFLNTYLLHAGTNYQEVTPIHLGSREPQNFFTELIQLHAQINAEPVESQTSIPCLQRAAAKNKESIFLFIFQLLKHYRALSSRSSNDTDHLSANNLTHFCSKCSVQEFNEQMSNLLRDVPYLNLSF